MKIFLNANSTMDDVSKELAAFLDYVARREMDDSFVKKLDEAVKRAKKNREWRVLDIRWMSVKRRPERSGERIYDVVNERSGK